MGGYHICQFQEISDYLLTYYYIHFIFLDKGYYVSVFNTINKVIVQFLSNFIFLWNHFIILNQYDFFLIVFLFNPRKMVWYFSRIFCYLWKYLYHGYCSNLERSETIVVVVCTVNYSLLLEIYYIYFLIYFKQFIKLFARATVPFSFKCRPITR